MRKTLTLVAAVLTAGSLAACKPFWQREEPPAPTATAIETTATGQAVTTDPAKSVEQTAAAETEKPVTAEKTPAVK